MREVFKRNIDEKVFIFLGDGERELDEMREEYPDKTILNVRGNCDFGSQSPDTDIYIANGVKLIFTHGHNHGVKYSPYRMLCLAKECGATIALYGHTHIRSCEYVDGIYLLNPGSASQPRDYGRPCYAFIDITDKGVFCNHVDL